MKQKLYTDIFKYLRSLPVVILILLSFHDLVNAQTNITVNAGDDFTACENAILLAGEATNYNTVLWGSNGDGFFSDATALSTEYFPGENDLLAGQVEVCLTAYNEGEEATDCVNVNLILAPSINLNVVQDTICHDEAYTFENVEILNYSAIQWFTTDGGGNFSNENIPNPSYFPSPFVDYAQGCIHIVVLAQGINPCETYIQDEMELCFSPNAQVNLGGQMQYACYGENYTFEDATATGTSYLEWMPVTGGGYFENPNEINATYVPDPEFDYPQGCIYVLLAAQPISPCTGSVEEYAAICFNPTPEVNAGTDAVINAGQSFTPSPVVVDYDNLLWETSGDGTFSNPGLLSPNYFPGTADNENGVVTLTLSASSGGTCSASDDLILTIITQQMIEIPQGWSGLSTFVNTEGLSFEEITAPIADKLLFAQNELQLYWPEYGINSMNSVPAPKAYKVYLSNAASLPLAGSASSKTVDLLAGWNLLPVPVSCPVAYQELIDMLGSNLIIVTEIGGQNIIWPEGNIFTLTELLPGKAYMIKVTDTEQIEFPDCE